MSLQVATKKCTIRSIITRTSFQKGFNEARQGKPFDYDTFEGDANKQWRYERGRLLAQVYHGKLKEGRNVLQEAINAYALAMHDNIII